MQQALFSITNLSCGYNSNRTVLSVDALKIYSGQITFIVGKSGSGKSTMLETLGFMNNTFNSKNAKQVIFHDNKTKVETDMVGLWPQKIANHSKFRNDHFSFIFQENNLLEHFCASDNILVPMLLAGNDSKTAMDEIRHAFKEIHLPEHLMAQNTRMLSGGQRQRISFLRALLSKKPVLFGDEPTGNLDPVTARALMTMIKDNIGNTGSSAIIVSHDLPLACNFADRIIMLKVDEETQMGVIGNIFEKKGQDWVNEISNESIDQSEIINLL